MSNAKPQNSPKLNATASSAALHAAPDAIVIVGKEGRIVFVNSETENLFRYDKDELLQQPLEALVPERLHAEHRADMAGFMASPKRRPMGMGLETRGLRKDGTEVSRRNKPESTRDQSGHPDLQHYSGCQRAPADASGFTRLGTPLSPAV